MTFVYGGFPSRFKTLVQLVTLCVVQKFSFLNLKENIIQRSLIVQLDGGGLKKKTIGKVKVIMVQNISTAKSLTRHIGHCFRSPVSF